MLLEDTGAMSNPLSARLSEIQAANKAASAAFGGKAFLRALRPAFPGR